MNPLPLVSGLLYFSDVLPSDQLSPSTKMTRARSAAAGAATSLQSAGRAHMKHHIIVIVACLSILSGQVGCGTPLASGISVYRLMLGRISLSRTIILLK